MSEIKSQAEIAELEHELMVLRAENNELRSLQEIFSKAFNENQTCMAISRQDSGVFVDVNENYARTLGFSKEEMIGKGVVELGIWGEMEDRQVMHQELLEKGYVKDVVYKFKRRTGELGHGLATINIVDIHGEKHLLTSFINITERKTAQQALADSQKLFEQIFNSIPLAIIINSFDGRVVEVNDAFLNRNKIKRHEVIGTNNVHNRIWKESGRLPEYLRDIRRHGLVKNMEAEYYTPSGKVRTVLLSGILINWQGEDCALTISNDITEIKQYETEISRLDNLNLMGQMAASIAHEVRNPLTSIRGFLQLFESHYSYRADRETIDLMIEEVDRINDIISTFLSLAHKNTLTFKLQSLNKIVFNLMPLIIADALKSDVYVETELNDVSPSPIDENEIRQLLINLVRNGIKAMGEGGTLKIRVNEDSVGVHLVVLDQGNGIPDDVLDKMGTPFFTTKPNGTGLGLAVCYSIAEKHGARMRFDTGPHGTSFQVTFPVPH